MRYLEPRDFRLDDFLRKPLPAGRWGEEGFLRLSIQSEGIPVAAAEGVWRPSHTSLFGLGEGELQVTEDRFTTIEDVLISVVSLRNAGPHALDIAIKFGWETALAVRIAPPGDDLIQRVESGGRIQFVFAAAESRSSAESWSEERNPVRKQVEALEGWLKTYAPRLDSPDLAHMQAFYEGWYARWLQQDTSGRSDDTLETLLNPTLTAAGELTLRPALNNLPRFCIADWPIGQSRITVVWDDPEVPGDAYDDGLKGLVVWKDGKRAHQQDNLAPLTLAVS
ncbi:MAG: hypothetical protein QM758_22425 [Armatimonas sp.]